MRSGRGNRRQDWIDAKRDPWAGDSGLVEDCSLLPGKRVVTKHGDAHVITKVLDRRHRHGRQRVSSALHVPTDVVAKLALSPDLAGVDPSRMLFVDTETTGLAGVAQTVPFLIGMAWFEGSSLVVQQLLAPELGDEKGILWLLSERIAQAQGLVTFNGKSFDWPLLRARFVKHRVKVNVGLPHLDLLHCARRVFKARLSSTRLIDIEREIFGLVRRGDVPGWAIPGIYFDYLEEGDAAPLYGVVEHNANDLIALAALLGRLGQHFDDVRGGDDPRDHLAYAKVAERAGDPRRARSFANAVLNGNAKACGVEAGLLTARLARRGGRLDEEERALQQALTLAQDQWQEASVHLALAKLYEHRRKDLKKALEHARHTYPVEDPNARQRRRDRLNRRLDR